VKKVIGLPLLAFVLAALVALAPGAAQSSIGDANGPACRDITNGTFNYAMNPDGTFNLNAQLLLGDAGTTPACKSTTYTLYVIVDGTDPTTALPFAKDGSAQWLNEITITDDDPTICVFATTATGRVFDTAPDTGCLSLTAPTTGGPGGFN
jgi:hypothetical protein